MFNVIRGSIPQIDFFTSQKVGRFKVERAYKDLSTTYCGIFDFVEILENIGEGLYSLNEVIIAGIMLAAAEEGILIGPGKYVNGHYVKVNGLDVVVLDSTKEIICEDELRDCEFCSNNGIVYRQLGSRGKFVFAGKEGEKDGRKDVQKTE